MQVSKTLADWRRVRAALTGAIGFVPTMGALHAGHAALLQRSVAENDITVASIYVNPTQFDNQDDLAAYPGEIDKDLECCDALGVDQVLLPSREGLYADGYRYRIEETEFGGELCGAHRPGHFTGVLTVVMKLLNLVCPKRAYFGEKDYQQCLLIRGMTEAFFLDVDIVPCATVREADGLALSSRNALLTAASRALAPRLHELLGSSQTDQAVANQLEALGFDVDYVISRFNRRFAAASVAGLHGPVRLIDNVVLPDTCG